MLQAKVMEINYLIKKILMQELKKSANWNIAATHYLTNVFCYHTDIIFNYFIYGR